MMKQFADGDWCLDRSRDWSRYRCKLVRHEGHGLSVVKVVSNCREGQAELTLVEATMNRSAAYGGRSSAKQLAAC